MKESLNPVVWNQILLACMALGMLLSLPVIRKKTEIVEWLVTGATCGFVAFQVMFLLVVK